MSTNPSPMRGPLTRPAAASTPAPEAPVAGVPESDLSLQVGGQAAVDFEATPDLGLSEGAPQADKPVVERTVNGAEKALGQNTKDRVTFVKESVMEATGQKFLDQANDAAFFQVIKPNGLKGTMPEAVRVGTMVAFGKLADARYIPQSRTIAMDAEALNVTIEKRRARVEEGINLTKPEFREAAAKTAEYDYAALGLIKEAGDLAIANDDQFGVRALTAMLQGQAAVSYCGYIQRRDAGLIKDLPESGIKENFPSYREGRPSNATQGIKKADFLLAKAKEWMSYEVTDADRFYEKDGVQQEVQPKTADAKARARKATEICHIFAVPALTTDQKEFLTALGRKHEAKPGLNEKQVEAVDLLKANLANCAQNIPAELTPELRDALAGGVEVDGHEGTEVFQITEAELQDEFFAHLKAETEGGNAKADNYFGKMWKSREMAHALVQNYFTPAE